MWILLGVLSLITGTVGVIFTFQNKDSHWLSYVSLSLTTLAICVEYSTVVKWVKEEDWASLMDVAPTMSSMLWLFTIGSIGINSLSFWKKLKFKAE